MRGSTWPRTSSACSPPWIRLQIQISASFSAGTDGVDGNSPVAGAVADSSTLSRARDLNFDPLQTLLAFDACPLFSALGDTIITGRTGHNLRDLRLFLSKPTEA